MSKENQQENKVDLGPQYQVNLYHKDIELIFKYLGRADLKGIEVPEMNKVIGLFDPNNLKKV